ncbi:molecular chaperone, partial [Klebsiella quasipneumoniae]|uniref:fimbrial biogenesis chaperone n=3 Tax=Klebsiella quasipneumoniae TaxID=1463165 RepID=UPI003B42A48C
ALSAEFTIGEGELMAHDVPLGCAPDEYDDLISGTCSHLPKSGQTLRIKLGSSAGLAKDKETLWWLNLLEIPPVVANQKNEGQNVLQLAIRSRFKFIYRPAGLGNRDAAAEKLTLTASGSSLAISNPTPFYITVSRISRDGGKALNSKTVMLAPQSSQTVALSSAVNRGETLTVNNINDYGADVAVKVAVK